VEFSGSAPQRDAISVGAKVSMIQPTGAPVTVIGFYKYSTRWGAAPHTPLSTNMHPGWGGEDFFTPSEVVDIKSVPVARRN